MAEMYLQQHLQQHRCQAAVASKCNPSARTSSRKQLPTISSAANPRTSFAFEEQCSYDTQFPPNVDIRAPWTHDTGVFTTVGSSGLQL
jgi:hypothetical protein